MERREDAPFHSQWFTNSYLHFTVAFELQCDTTEVGFDHIGEFGWFTDVPRWSSRLTSDQTVCLVPGNRQRDGALPRDGVTLIEDGRHRYLFRLFGLVLTDQQKRVTRFAKQVGSNNRSCSK
ncbi:hypothetical protein SAMN05192552_104610 [Natrinema hispanicum]|uniref:Uncharacterized protein n=1 Tax=Natrinema hispanicum TaxID=392421 RepID=A0A1G6XCT0_9EURY|nr:hypothetical protein SAMN05192552_104610 [Natrinema hispanicum]SEU09096.1 hypothetical protein SAMN04488694_14115 [Natrinema hispanicum]